MSGLFVAIVGPSGSGKDSLIRALGARFRDDPDFLIVRRVVTRPSDAYEDHDTLDLDAFLTAEAAGRYALSWGAHGLHYGVPVEIDDALASGKTVVGNLSRKAVETARRRWQSVFAVLITARPETLAARLAARGREAEDARLGRLARATEIDFTADAVLANDGALEDAAERLAELVREQIQIKVGA